MSNEEILTRQRAAVLSCIMHGKDLANDHHWIATHTGLPERAVRNRIEELRNEGYLICNLQNGKGYFLAENDEDVKTQYRQDCARAMSILRRIKPFRKYLKSLEDDENQINFMDILEEE